MSHPTQLAFFAHWIETFPEKFSDRVIDFGSWDVNGGPHRLIEPAQYVGVDLSAGPNVTLVSPGELVDLPSASFSVAMASETFEHAPTWQAILVNMIRLTQPSGIVIFTCAGRGRREHGTTASGDPASAQAAVQIGQEHYANVSMHHVARSLNLQAYFDEFVLTEEFEQSDTLFCGVRSESSAQDLAKFRMAKVVWESRNLGWREHVRRLVVHLTGDGGLKQLRKLRA